MAHHALLPTLALSLLLLTACANGEPVTDDTNQIPMSSSAESSTSAAALLPGVQAARAMLAGLLGVEEQSIVIVDAQETTWPDACLGLPREGEACAQMITSGYSVLLEYQGAEYRFRSNRGGTVVRAE